MLVWDQEGRVALLDTLTFTTSLLGRYRDEKVVKSILESLLLLPLWSVVLLLMTQRQKFSFSIGRVLSCQALVLGLISPSKPFGLHDFWQSFLVHPISFRGSPGVLARLVSYISVLPF